MACKVITQRLAVLACLAAVALGCTDRIYPDLLPKDIEGFLNDPAIWPMRVVLANEENIDAAALISCYEIDSDFKVTAYNSDTGKQAYSAVPTSKAVSNTTYKVTYSPSQAYFLGVTKGNTSLTLTLQAVTNEFILWEGCSADSNKGSNWLLLKNTAKELDYGIHCVEKSLKTSFNIDNTLRKGVCS